MYNLTIIHDLLLAAFNNGEITTLAFDLFYDPVYKQLSSSMATSNKINKMLEYASQDEERIEKLLTHVKQKNPYQYNRFADRLVQK